MKIGDLGLDLNPQAWEVLKRLSERDVSLGEQATLKTQAWYNGRERGFCVKYQPHWLQDSTLYFCVAQHRISEELIVYSWDGPWKQEPLDGSDVPEDVYRRSRCFHREQYDAAADFIANTILVHSVQAA
jgi:hypothetical protein